MHCSDQFHGSPSGHQEYFLAELSPTVLPNLRRVLQSLKDKGASLHSVSLPSTPLALGAYYVLACAEASSNLARYDGIRFGAPMQTRPTILNSLTHQQLDLQACA